MALLTGFSHEFLWGLRYLHSINHFPGAGRNEAPTLGARGEGRAPKRPDQGAGRDRNAGHGGAGGGEARGGD